MPPEHGVVSSNLTGRAILFRVRPGHMGYTTYLEYIKSDAKKEHCLPLRGEASPMRQTAQVLNGAGVLESQGAALLP